MWGFFCHIQLPGWMSNRPPFLAPTKNSAVRDLVSAKGFKLIFLEPAYSPTPSEWTYYIGTSDILRQWLFIHLWLP